MADERPSPVRWALVILVVAAIIGLVAFARGEPERGGPRVAAIAGLEEAG